MDSLGMTGLLKGWLIAGSQSKSRCEWYKRAIKIVTIERLNSINWMKLNFGNDLYSRTNQNANDENFRNADKCGPLWWFSS